MSKPVMVVWSNPSDPAREDEFNEWYDGVHVPDVLKIPGILSCTRYKLSDTQFGPVETPGTYVAYYEVDPEKLAGIPAAFGEAFVAGELPMSDVMAPGPIVLLEAVSEHRP